MTTFIPPEIRIVEIKVRKDGVNLDLYYPKCIRCGWAGESVRTSGLAKVDAGVHIKTSCIAEMGEGNANTV